MLYKDETTTVPRDLATYIFLFKNLFCHNFRLIEKFTTSAKNFWIIFTPAFPPPHCPPPTALCLILFLNHLSHSCRPDIPLPLNTSGCIS